MSAIPDGRRHRWSVDEYLRMGEQGLLGPETRTELIDGGVVHMPPIGATHAGMVASLTRRLTFAVGDRALVWARNPVMLFEHDAPQPDACLLRPRADEYRRSLPEAADVLLIIEVSDSTLACDRDHKAPMYARAGIPESWRIEVGAERIVVQREPHNGRYAVETIATAPWRTDIVALPELFVDLSGLF